MAGSRAHACKHKSRVRLQQEHTEHRKHCNMPLRWSVVPQVVEAYFWVQMMKKLKEIQKYSLGSTRQRQKMWINKFSFQKKICLGKMSSMRDVSNFHKKILGPPLYKRHYYTLYPCGYQFQSVLWKKNIQRGKCKEMFQFACYLKKLFGSNQQYIFMCFSLLFLHGPAQASTLLSLSCQKGLIWLFNSVKNIAGSFKSFISFYESVAIQFTYQSEGIALPLLPSHFVTWISLRRMKI